MEKKINVGISNRHIHLTEETYNLLFDKAITKKNDLKQVGEYSTNETLSIEANGKKLENVRIIGPFRSYNQFEILRSDARKMNLFPPVRTSGDLSGAEEVTLITEKNSITINCCVIAKRHIHISNKTALELGIKDKDVVQVLIDNEKRAIVDFNIKVSENGYLEAHIDVDDANAFMLEENDEVTILL